MRRQAGEQLVLGRGIAAGGVSVVACGRDSYLDYHYPLGVLIRLVEQ